MGLQPMTQGLQRDLVEELRGLDTRFLLAIHQGDIDPVVVARRVLADRGLGPDGRWLGFSEAYQALGLSSDT